MPVRIYDIARKLGIESKEVLAKARELGITTAKVPSSSLDKITAEYLEHQIGGKTAEPESAQETKTSPEPVVFVSAPEAKKEQKGKAKSTAKEKAKEKQKEKAAEPEPSTKAKGKTKAAAETDSTTAASQPAKEKEPKAEPQPVEAAAEATPETTAQQEAKKENKEQIPASQEEPITATQPSSEETIQKPAEQPPPKKPEPPPGPRLGEKIGFIQLPSRPAARSERDRERERGRQTADRRKEPRERERERDRPQSHDARTGGRVPPGRPLRPGQPSPAAEPGSGRGQAAARSTAEPVQPRKPAAPQFTPPPGAEIITMKPPIVVRQLADALNTKAFKLIADLMEIGVFATVNQAIDESVAAKICAKYGYRFELEKRERGAGVTHAQPKKIDLDFQDKPESLKIRPPVITIMGHVDHGKTTLLDVIRKSDVAAGEAGGITQHIGAYTISFPHPERSNELQQITFLDTPGHAAFSAMRARGANVTDIVVLVVAANDGVMPQTMEALNHAKAANVPIIVAVNKCDHPAADSTKVRAQLQEKGLVCEEWGGETIFQDVSALSGQGVDKLLELILLQAEIMELKANPDRLAMGNVVESGLEPGGPTATVLVRKGTLKLGDILVCGPYWGKARALINEEGKRLKEATPSTAVKVLGLNGVPDAGLEFNVVESEKTARSIVEKREEAARTSKDTLARPKVTLESLFDSLSSDTSKVLKVVVKADTQGSVEAIVDALKKTPSEKVSLDVIHQGVGAITESDVLLSSASKAIIIGFHTRVDSSASEAAKREGIQIKLYSIIYELIEEVKEAMAGLLEPITREVELGTAEIRKVFELSKGPRIAGCVISSGRVTKGKCRVVRRNNTLYEGIIQSLRRFQDEVNEVRTGMECGIRIDGFDDFEEGDQIQSYTVEKVAQKL